VPVTEPLYYPICYDPKLLAIALEDIKRRNEYILRQYELDTRVALPSIDRMGSGFSISVHKKETEPEESDRYASWQDSPSDPIMDILTYMHGAMAAPIAFLGIALGRLAQRDMPHRGAVARTVGIPQKKALVILSDDQSEPP
jgi:hypothetical protein